MNYDSPFYFTRARAQSYTACRDEYEADFYDGTVGPGPGIRATPNQVIQWFLFIDDDHRP